MFLVNEVQVSVSNQSFNLFSHTGYELLMSSCIDFKQTAAVASGNVTVPAHRRGLFSGINIYTRYQLFRTTKATFVKATQSLLFLC